MIIIGEKINGAIPSVAQAIEERNADYIGNLAKMQAEAGVSYIDVCASVGDEIEIDVMKWLIEIVQEVTEVPIAIDSPNPNTCVHLIEFCNKPGLINSVSMEKDKIDCVFPMIAKTKWGCVALLCAEHGIPDSAEKRFAVFEQIMKKAEEYKIEPSRLFIDPLVEMLCTSEDGIALIIEVIKKIRTRYADINITGAISNISYNLPARKLINQAFLITAMNAGMNSAVLDPLDKDMMGLIFATEALIGKDEFCMEYISAYRAGQIGSKTRI